MKTITGHVGPYTYHIDMFGEKMEVQIYLGAEMQQAYRVSDVAEGHCKAMAFAGVRNYNVIFRSEFSSSLRDSQVMARNDMEAMAIVIRRNKYLFDAFGDPLPISERLKHFKILSVRSL